MFLRLPSEKYKILCRQVLDRDGWKCRHCGFRETLSCHHIVFRSEGGDDVSWNLVTVCERCHSALHRYELFISVPEDSWVGTGGGADGKVLWDS
jgi:predicted HNH restriction endonuclease